MKSAWYIHLNTDTIDLTSINKRTRLDNINYILGLSELDIGIFKNGVTHPSNWYTICLF